ncbi:hypothetical protein Taro_027525 [Colocasia esculenta]|uniref:Transcription factor MYBS1 n=1 Tax=Colocasia esculenta TaxID=4460 RepID=A0A843VNZ3_COLES|nr:hypothetical protein [Colocasia esculenta]
MEILFPTAPYLHGSSGLFARQSSRRSPGGFWTHEENKRFENALAEFDEGTPDRWANVARMIPGKTPEDVRRHYQDLEADVCHIEAGLIPPPGYGSQQFTLDWVSSQALDGLTPSYYFAGGRRQGGGPYDQERKKGIPWTEDEHKRFLMGLKTYGKGDWRNISRKCVISRTPAQVASHAQKYYIRLRSTGKEKRRPSIHDITTGDVSDSRPPSPPPPQPSSAHSSSLLHPSALSSEIQNPAWAVSPVQGTLFFERPYGHSSLGVKSGA